MSKHYLLVSDFDQTLSFNDSGIVLSELLGIPDFAEKVAGLARLNLVQQGAELAYLLRHDPEYRRVRKDHLVEVGRRIVLKRNVERLTRLLPSAIDGYRFDFRIVSAAPEEVIHSALEGIVPAEHVIATQLGYDHVSGEINSVTRVTAGFGKVAAVEALRAALGVPRDHVVYVGDGSSDIHVMLHVNRRDGFTTAVSENNHIAPIARRTVLSDNALCVLVPILEDMVGCKDPAQVRAFFESHGLQVQEWDKMQVDLMTIRGA